MPDHSSFENLIWQIADLLRGPYRPGFAGRFGAGTPRVNDGSLLFQSVFTVSDPDAEPVSAGKNQGFEPDSSLRDTESIPLKIDVDAYFETEVKPYVPDAWMDRSKDRVGYEINFNRYFYVYTPPRALAEIDADLKRAEDAILRLLQEVTT